MSYLYLTENGSAVSINGNYITVSKDNAELRRVPIETLDSISIFGKSQLTTQCIETLLTKRIPVTFYSMKGTYYGKLCSTYNENAHRQRMQAGLQGTDTALELSKRIIHAKAKNQLVILQRYGSGREETDYVKNEIKKNMVKIAEAKDVSELMGYEGIIARHYFNGIEMIANPMFAFHGRNKRPPRDPVNAMLSLGYSLLINEIYGKIEAGGLNPYFGFMHSDREGHPALCSDLIEEWRAVLVDSTVLSLINGNEIGKEAFYNDEETGGTYLNKDGMKTFISKMENKMNSENSYLDYIDYKVTFRRAMELQINSFSKMLESGDPDKYHPLVIR